jgi:hypothetical protein
LFTLCIYSPPIIYIIVSLSPPPPRPSVIMYIFHIHLPPPPAPPPPPAWVPTAQLLYATRPPFRALSCTCTYMYCYVIMHTFIFSPFFLIQHLPSSFPLPTKSQNESASVFFKTLLWIYTCWAHLYRHVSLSRAMSLFLISCIANLDNCTGPHIYLFILPTSLLLYIRTVPRTATPPPSPPPPGLL